MTRAHVLLFLAICCSCAAQQASLRIVSPSNGSAVRPGTAVDIVVEPGSEMEFVSIGGEGGMADGLQSPPFRFTLLVPRTKCGDHQIVAFGKAKTGSVVYSVPINLKIACESEQGLLEASPSELTFQYAGLEIPLSVVLKAQNGAPTMVAVGALEAKSSNELVATVSNEGIVTAVGPGAASITLRALGINQPATVVVTVRNALRGDLDGDDDVDSDDLAELQVALKQSNVIPTDARDLNKDRRIDALDTRLLVTLCTRSRCANQ